MKEITIPVWVIVVLAILIIFHFSGCMKHVTRAAETLLMPIADFSLTQANAVETILRGNALAGR
jgi:hypothetical protein